MSNENIYEKNRYEVLYQVTTMTIERACPVYLQFIRGKSRIIMVPVLDMTTFFEQNRYKTFTNAASIERSM